MWHWMYQEMLCLMYNYVTISTSFVEAASFAFVVCKHSANFLGLIVRGRFGPTFPRLCGELAGDCPHRRLSETTDFGGGV